MPKRETLRGCWKRGINPAHLQDCGPLVYPAAQDLEGKKNENEVDKVKINFPLPITVLCFVLDSVDS